MPLDLGAPAAEITRLAAGVRDDQLDLPDPLSGNERRRPCWPISSV